MKKTIILSIIFCALFAYLPFTAQAMVNNITSASVAPESLVADTATTHTIEITTSAALLPGDKIDLQYVNASLLSEDFNCVEAEISNSDISASLSCEGNFFRLTLDSALSSGTYSFDLTVTNYNAGAYQLMITSYNFTDYVLSDEFTITETEAVTNPFSAIVLTSDSYITGAEADYTIDFTTSREIASGEDFNIMITQPLQAPDESGFDFSQATYTNASGSLGAQCLAIVENMAVQCTTTTTIPSGTFDLIISGVINTSTAGDYSISVTTDDIGPTATYTTGTDPYAFADLTVPGKIKKSKLSVKNKKKASAKLKWTAKARATKYQTTLQRKKLNKKKYTLVKKFKGITNTYKVLKKNKKYLKTKRVYRFRVRAGNDAGWGTWSAWKKFTMN